MAYPWTPLHGSVFWSTSGSLICSGPQKDARNFQYILSWNLLFNLLGVLNTPPLAEDQSKDQGPGGFHST